MTSRPESRGISMSTTTRSTGSSSKRSSASTPSEQIVTSALSERSICEATIWLVGLSSARSTLSPVRSGAAGPPAAAAPPAVTSAGKRTTASTPPAGRLPTDDLAAEPVGQRLDDVQADALPGAIRPRRAIAVAEHLLERPRRQARAVVGDAEGDGAVRLAADPQPHRCRSR